MTSITDEATQLKTELSLLGLWSETDPMNSLPTLAQVKSAYRQRVRLVHPDRNPHPDAAEQFERLTTAKQVLVNYIRLCDSSIPMVEDDNNNNTSDDFYIFRPWRAMDMFHDPDGDNLDGFDDLSWIEDPYLYRQREQIWVPDQQRWATIVRQYRTIEPFSEQEMILRKKVKEFMLEQLAYVTAWVLSEREWSSPPDMSHPTTGIPLKQKAMDPMDQPRHVPVAEWKQVWEGEPSYRQSSPVARTTNVPSSTPFSTESLTIPMVSDETMTTTMNKATFERKKINHNDKKRPKSVWSRIGGAFRRSPLGQAITTAFKG